MKKLLGAGAFVLAMVFTTSASAQEVAVTTAPADGGGYNPFVVGGFMSMGMALAVGDMNGDASGDLDQKPRFAGGGGAYFDFYLMPILALEGGIDFIGKGHRFKVDEGGIDATSWYRYVYMEIPLGAKLNIKGFQASLAVVLNFALSGKVKTKTDDNETTDTVSGDDWDYTRRANIGLRVGLGYAIPVGPIAIVPGLSWSMHLLNDIKGEPADDGNCKARAMNLMFNVGVEFGFGA